MSEPEDAEAVVLAHRERMGLAISVAQLVGTRVQRARKRKGLSQKELGEAVGTRLGKTWPKQIVSAVEQGRRDCNATELVALAMALDVPIVRFLERLPGPLGIGTNVRLPAGETLTGNALLDVVVGKRSADVEAAANELQNLITRMNGEILKLRLMAQHSTDGGEDES